MGITRYVDVVYDGFKTNRNESWLLEGIGNNIVVTLQCKIKWDINCVYGFQCKECV